MTRESKRTLLKEASPPLVEPSLREAWTGDAGRRRQALAAGDTEAAAYRAPAPDAHAEPYFWRGLGDKAGKIFGVGKPMGSWTGLPIYAGAPLSGALWGTGAGLTLTGWLALKDLIEGKEPEYEMVDGKLVRVRRRWGRNALLGALAGAGIGGGVAYLTSRKDKEGSDVDGGMKKTATESDRLIVLTALSRDSALSYADRRRLMAVLESSSDAEIKRIRQALYAISGAGAGFVIARLLGISLSGSLLGAAVGGFLGNRWGSSKTVYV